MTKCLCYNKIHIFKLQNFNTFSVFVLNVLYNNIMKFVDWIVFTPRKLRHLYGLRFVLSWTDLVSYSLGTLMMWGRKASEPILTGHHIVSDVLETESSESMVAPVVKTTETSQYQTIEYDGGWQIFWWGVLLLLHLLYLLSWWILSNWNQMKHNPDTAPQRRDDYKTKYFLSLLHNSSSLQIFSNLLI